MEIEFKNKEDINKYASSPILLFDGICCLCNKMVLFIIKRDETGIIKFATLQSSFAQALLMQNTSQSLTYQTVVLIYKNKIYTHSTAVLELLRHLGGIWKFLYVLIIIPKPLRDFVYSIIAKHRYTIFGKEKECMVPGEEVKDRFIE